MKKERKRKDPKVRAGALLDAPRAPLITPSTVSVGISVSVSIKVESSVANHSRDRVQ
jgi:hypothetical protein